MSCYPIRSALRTWMWSLGDLGDVCHVGHRVASYIQLYGREVPVSPLLRGHFTRDQNLSHIDSSFLICTLVSR